MKARNASALLLLWMAAQPLLAQPVDLSGHWEGTIVVSPGELEVDVVTEITGGLDKHAKGELWFPLQHTPRYTLQSFSREGSHISFHIKDENNIVTSFEGEIADDGLSITGKMIEAGTNAPFTLQRRSPRPEAGVVLHRLSRDGSELRTAFNQHLGHPRIVVALSPFSLFSRTTLRLIERYVLDPIDDPRLRLFVVWESSKADEIAERETRESASIVTDPRVTHFWSPDGFLSGIYNPLSKSTDACLLFSADTLWADPPPAPHRFKQGPRGGAKAKIAEERKLNALDLSFDVQALLQSPK